MIGAGVAAARVPHVRPLGFQVLAVLVPERQAPEPLAGSLARPTRSRESRSSSVIRPAHSWPRATRTAPVSVAKSSSTSGRNFSGVGERVAENQPSLRVGVVHFDGLAVAHAQDVSGPLRPPARHVLRHGRESDDAHRQPQSRPRAARENRRRAHHVVLHLAHRGGGLERNAAGVEGDALSDQDHRLPRAGGPVLADEQERRPRAAGIDAENASHPFPRHVAPAGAPSARSGARAVMAFTSRASSAGPRSFAGVLPRSRAQAAAAATASASPAATRHPAAEPARGGARTVRPARGPFACASTCTARRRSPPGRAGAAGPAGAGPSTASPKAARTRPFPWRSASLSARRTARRNFGRRHRSLAETDERPARVGGQSPGRGLRIAWSGRPT